MKTGITTKTNVQELYNKYNEEYFNNDLPNLKVEWSNRMSTSAGLCYYKVKRISNKKIRTPYRIALNVKYHNSNPEEIVETLIHEMIHVELPEDGHGSKFKIRMKELNNITGLNITQYAHGSMEGIYKWEYTCKECGQRHKRTTKLKNYKVYTCGKCKGRLEEKSLNENTVQVEKPTTQVAAKTKNKTTTNTVRVIVNGITTEYKNFVEAGKEFGSEGTKDCGIIRTIHQIANGKSPKEKSKYYEQFKNIQVEYIK